MGYYILIGIVTLVSFLVSRQLKRKFKKYSQIGLQNGMSGREIAEKMLNDHGIYDVEVISVSGQLTDHYNPLKKTVNLSEVVYHERNAAAAAVAAHEVGHAVQHAKAYQWLTMRSKLVPIVNISSNFSAWIIFGGLLLGATQGSVLGFTVAVAGLILMGIATLFSFITLPVEYDASNRALIWLRDNHIVTPDEYEGSENALRWAARTYLVAALGSLASLVYWAMQVLGSNDDDNDDN